MVVDRIERHDIVNAVLLAAALLVLGFAIVTAVDKLFQTMDEGLVVASKGPEEDPASATATPVPPTSGSVPDDGSEGAPRPPAEVTVRVGNGARRLGVASAATEVLKEAGYTTIPPKNGPTLTNSIAYYLEGYEADAALIAGLLAVEAGQVQPMPEDPGVPIDDAKVIVVLGTSSEF